MCTVIVRVPAHTDEPVRMLAVRDEDPRRAWDPLGPWWPDSHPGVVGVRDARAGGAWLAADPSRSRVSVILNRHEVEGATGSRGAVVLDAVVGRAPVAAPPTHGFNLVDIDASGARVTSWDGDAVRSVRLEPGVHMIAHDEVDDAATPRIAAWLTAFDAAPSDAADGPWYAEWLAVLERSASLPPTDDRAIVRDNRPHGIPTLSLLMCAASIDASGVDIVYGELDAPGAWNRPALHHVSD
ncbi:NRDE family protein [Microbacterium hatanonis]|uniref:NRDE family protein n=1 Tax=Microbacterium hatanonis TaxID=404366 RepID=UPI001FE9EB20|nr:NRDE family protein [Microbacterium hatanonis]